MLWALTALLGSSGRLGFVAGLVFPDVSKSPSKRREPPSDRASHPTRPQPAFYECSVTLSLSACSPQTRCNGLAVVVDATRSAWRMTRACIRQVSVVLGADAAAIIVLRPDAFWDKQRMDSCARTQKEGEVRSSSGVTTEGDKAYWEWWYSPTDSYPGHEMAASGRH